MDNTKLTSVKILKILYERFKVSTVNSEMTLQKLTNRAIDLYWNQFNHISDMPKYVRSKPKRKTSN